MKYAFSDGNESSVSLAVRNLLGFAVSVFCGWYFTRNEMDTTNRIVAWCICGAAALFCLVFGVGFLVEAIKERRKRRS